MALWNNCGFSIHNRNARKMAQVMHYRCILLHILTV